MIGVGAFAAPADERAESRGRARMPLTLFVRRSRVPYNLVSVWDKDLRRDKSLPHRDPADGDAEFLLGGCGDRCEGVAGLVAFDQVLRGDLLFGVGHDSPPVSPASCNRRSMYDDRQPQLES